MIATQTKELWEMTREEQKDRVRKQFPPGSMSEEELTKYVTFQHRILIGKALEEGKPVPAEVLKDYPELIQAIPKASEGMPEAGLQLDMSGKTTPFMPKGKGTLVTASMDAYEKLQQIVAENEASEPKATPVEKRILAKMGDTPKHIDEVARELDIPIWEATSAISLLELKGEVRKAGGAVGEGMFFVKVKPEISLAKKANLPKTLKATRPSPADLMGTISREDADELMAGLDLRIDKLGERIDQGKATLDTMKETLDPRIAKLTELIPTTKEGRSEITHITKGQYRKVWGKEPPASIVSNGKVRWEYALDTIAQELHLEGKAQTEGKNPDEYLKGLIEDAKGEKELIHATRAEVEGDERTLKAIEKLKGSIKGRIGKTTSDTLLHTLAKPVLKGKSKPVRKAVTMLAGEAQALIDRIQAKRSRLAVAIDTSKLAVEIVPMSKAGLWGKHPNRLDIRGIDTPRRGRIKAGVGYIDRKGSRLSRRQHRGWRPVRF